MSAVFIIIAVWAAVTVMLALCVRRDAAKRKPARPTLRLAPPISRVIRTSGEVVRLNGQRDLASQRGRAV
jgi:hypothetical protein